MSPHAARARVMALRAAADALQLSRPLVFWSLDGHEDTHEGRALAAIEAAIDEARRELQAHTSAAVDVPTQARQLVETHGPSMAGAVAAVLRDAQETPQGRAWWAAVCMALDVPEHATRQR